MSTIYVIARETTHESYDYRDYTTEDIDPDYGYFTDKADAEAFVEALDKPAREDYEARLAQYNKELAAHQAKQDEASKLGFRHDYHLYRPTKPDNHLVIEVQPGKVHS